MVQIHQKGLLYIAVIVIGLSLIAGMTTDKSKDDITVMVDGESPFWGDVIFTYTDPNGEQMVKYDHFTSDGKHDYARRFNEKGLTVTATATKKGYSDDVVTIQLVGRNVVRKAVAYSPGEEVMVELTGEEDRRG